PPTGKKTGQKPTKQKSAAAPAKSVKPFKPVKPFKKTTSPQTAKRDPHFGREAEKYANPIPSREFIIELLENSGGPMDHPALCEKLNLQDEEQIEALRRRLGAMCRDGQLLQNRRNGFVPAGKADLVKGRVLAHRDGFGFLRPEDGDKDMYLSAREMRMVFDGDTVLASPRGIDKRGRVEAAIVEVLARAHQQLAGRFFEEDGVFYVKPDSTRINQDIAIPPQNRNNARHGQMVVVGIDHYPDHKRMAVGRVIEVLGEHLDPGMEIQIAVRNHGIPWQWPAAVEKEAAVLSETVLAKDKKHRIDLRHLPLVTIDGEDARDFDDAVYCEPRKGGGWTLYVAIADVSHYVTPKSALDREAEHRATSVYFPGSVVPMLPEKISNGLCSLMPKVDRLCMVCEMTINTAGKISKFQFYEGLMHSQARFTYTTVAQIIAAKTEKHDSEKNGTVRKLHAALAPHVDNLYSLYQALRGARDERGAIDFETQETRIIFADNRKIDRIIPVVRNEAHKLIEECMLAANTCAATLLEKQKMPALFRVHEGPSEEKLKNLRAFLGELGLGLGGGSKPTPGDYQTLLASAVGRSDARLIQTMLLRSMSQAVYQPENIGHFGLDYDSYAHFTSPIRRYPDLLVHRAIRYLVRNRPEVKQVRCADGAPKLPQNKIYPYDDAAMDAFGVQCSSCERRADEASRDVVAWLKCEYLLDHVEETFDGVINAVTSFGLFVELKDIYIEGLVHVTMLKRDYYHFDAAGQRLVGERTREVYRLGDSVQVRVVRVDLDDRKIDLELLQLYRPKKDSQNTEKKKPFAKSNDSVKTNSTEKTKAVAKKSSAKKPEPAAKKKKPAGGKAKK
ncbi:MAG TPA: ribonuclease R, partial [Pseudomonadales bacterium]|nr:ribonuclease R [Pseudomonadales bacterium]